MLIHFNISVDMLRICYVYCLRATCVYIAFYSMFGRRKLNLLRTANKKKSLHLYFHFLSGEKWLGVPRDVTSRFRVGHQENMSVQ